MKTLNLLAIMLLTAVISKAQLKNTKWAGKLNIPNETKVVLDFKKDSVDMIIADEGMVGETMTYSVKDSVLTLNKTSGNSPCDASDVAKVKFIIKDDKLFLTNQSDPCDARAQAWTTEPLIRVKH